MVLVPRVSEESRCSLPEPEHLLTGIVALMSPKLRHVGDLSPLLPPLPRLSGFTIGPDNPNSGGFDDIFGSLVPSLLDLDDDRKPDGLPPPLPEIPWTDFTAACARAVVSSDLEYSMIPDNDGGEPECSAPRAPSGDPNRETFSSTPPPPRQVSAAVMNVAPAAGAEHWEPETNGIPAEQPAESRQAAAVAAVAATAWAAGGANPGGARPLVSQKVPLVSQKVWSVDGGDFKPKGSRPRASQHRPTTARKKQAGTQHRKAGGGQRSGKHRACKARAAKREDRKPALPVAFDIALADLAPPGILPADHTPARGRGRQLQLAAMTPAQRKAEEVARLERNRLSAISFRARRKQKESVLLDKVREFQRLNAAQAKTIAKLNAQLARLTSGDGSAAKTERGCPPAAGQ